MILYVHTYFPNTVQIKLSYAFQKLAEQHDPLQILPRSKTYLQNNVLERGKVALSKNSPTILCHHHQQNIFL